MRVIFLDIDGVLNTNDEARYHKLHEIEIARGYGTFAESFCPMPEQTKRLLKMANTFPNTQIVISSSWRNSGIPSHMWECLLYAAGGHNLPVRVNFEATNTLKLWEHRGLEIKQWLMDWDKLYREYQIRYNHEHILEDPIESFVILDDDRDMEPFMDRLVGIDGDFGLTDGDVEKAIEILKRPMFDIEASFIYNPYVPEELITKGVV